MTIDVQGEEAQEALVEVEEDLVVEEEEEAREDPKCIRQPALIAVTDVKFHLSLHMANRFTVIIVLKRMTIQEQIDPIDREEEASEKEISEDLILKTDKCIKPLALIAATDVKSPSGLQVINLFTAVIALVAAKAGILDQKNLINPRSSMNGWIKNWIKS